MKKFIHTWFQIAKNEITTAPAAGIAAASFFGSAFHYTFLMYRDVGMRNQKRYSGKPEMPPKKRKYHH